MALPAIIQFSENKFSIEFSTELKLISFSEYPVETWHLFIHVSLLFYLEWQGNILFPRLLCNEWDFNISGLVIA